VAPDRAIQQRRPTVTTRQAIRVFVGLHAFAMLLLPKDSFGLMPYRPEDVTAVLLLLLFIVLAFSGKLNIPSKGVTILTFVYLSYFLLGFLTHDVSAGYVEASVFWIKELSYVVFGYLIWRAYRGDPQKFLDCLVVLSIPIIAVGMYQLVDVPRGMYGVAPFGHESSPASAGMLYFVCSIVAFMKCLTGQATRRYALMLVSFGVLLVAAGSKIAVLGALCFYGWYLAQSEMQKSRIRALKILGVFTVSAAAVIGVARIVGTLAESNLSSLTRYSGFLHPVDTLLGRGIWGKVNVIDDPFAVFLGSGYSPLHLSDGVFSYGMAADNQVLYYLIVGGTVGLALYLALMAALYSAVPVRRPEGRVLRALVIAYGAMGLGAEVLQLSIHGNAFWMLVGVCLALRPPPGACEIVTSRG
jgi:hypothetical protein